MTPDIFAHQADAWIDALARVFEHLINVGAIVLLAFMFRWQQVHAQALGRIEQKQNTIIQNTTPTPGTEAPNVTDTTIDNHESALPK